MWQPLTKSWYSRPKSGLVEDKNSGWKITLTRSERLLNSWQRLKAIMMGSVASLTMLCVVIGGNRDAPWQHYIKLFCHNRRWCNKMCNLWILLPTNLNSWVWLNNDRLIGIHYQSYLKYNFQSQIQFSCVKERDWTREKEMIKQLKLSPSPNWSVESSRKQKSFKVPNITHPIWAVICSTVSYGQKVFCSIGPWAKMHRFSLTMSFLDMRSTESGTWPRRQVSYIRFPMSFWISSIVSLRPFVTAWPLRDSTLKLFVAVGKMRNATTWIKIFKIFIFPTIRDLLLR